MIAKKMLGRVGSPPQNPLGADKTGTLHTLPIKSAPDKQQSSKGMYMH
jgi:hypothetical protein